MEKDCVTYCLKFAFLKVQLCIEKCYSNNKSFANMNSHHESIKLTVETNPTRFLGTAFNVNRDGSMITNKSISKTWKIYSLLEVSNT